MTEKLFWKTPYKTNFKAKITEITENKLVLDRTLFYPASGGQDSDKGILKSQDITAEVIDCVKDNDEIVHILKNSKKISNFKIGDQISGEIDWENRYLTMKSHTSQHIISAFADKILDAKTQRAVISPGEVSIQFSRKLTFHDLKKLHEAVSTQFCSKKTKIKTNILPREKAIEKYADKIRGKLAQDDPMRIVEIIEEDGKVWDVMCCGGTHVKTSTEIGPIFIQKFNKGNEIKYLVGSKAIELISSSNIELIDISSQLNQPIEKIPDTIRKNIEEIRKSNQFNKDLSFEFLQLLAITPTFTVNNINVIITELPFERRIITSAFKNFPPETLLFVYLSETSILILSSSDSIDASQLIKHLSTEFGGKGGGGPKVAQGTLKNTPNNLESIIKEFINI